MIVTAINALRIKQASDLRYSKIKLIPAIADMFSREMEMRPKRPEWFTGKIEIIPAISEIFALKC